jgi:flagellar hook assembly protein FlgD
VGPVGPCHFYHNPFHPRNGEKLSFCFEETRIETVVITIYNRRGHKIRSITDTIVVTGTFCESWDGRDDNGEFAPSGIYLVALRGPNWFMSGKAVLIK